MVLKLTLLKSCLALNEANIEIFGLIYIWTISKTGFISLWLDPLESLTLAIPDCKYKGWLKTIF